MLISPSRTRASARLRVTVVALATMIALAFLPSAHAVQPIEVTQLMAPNPTANQSFGISVAVDDDTLVGLRLRSAAGLAVASLFEPDQLGVWQHVAELDVSDPLGAWDPGAALDGDRAVLQVFSPSTGQASGVAVFERNAGGTNQWERVTTTFFAPTIAPNISLVTGDSIYTAAAFNEVGLRLDQDEADPMHWPVTATFQPRGKTIGSFGEALAVDGSTLVVGAPSTDSNTGAVYVFVDPRFLDGFETGDTSAWTTTVL